MILNDALILSFEGTSLEANRDDTKNINEQDMEPESVKKIIT